MGIWDYISSYGHSWTAVAKIDNAVRMKLYQSMPDEEARSKMSQFATDFAKNATVHACHEGLKIIPGLLLLQLQYHPPSSFSCLDFIQDDQIFIQDVHIHIKFELR
jgi:hypothetical protein